jgi:hypothetical protein
MPKIGQRSRDREMRLLLALQDDFEDRTKWRRSAKGNLWREWEDKVVTIFYRVPRYGNPGGYSWSISDDDDVLYSDSAYETVEDAMCDLWDAVRP